MIKPPIPLHEERRLQKLYALGLLDSEFEAFFDRITRVAATILNVPIALLTLVDRDRQWFKSRFGLEVSETSRDVSFCAHAILEDSPMVVEDARLDQRFSDNPLVTGPSSIRFYVGIPIVTQDGFALGTLCAADTQPRIINPAELQALHDLAMLIRSEIDNREAALHSQNQLARTESRFTHIVENAAIGISMLGPQGHWLDFNEEVCVITGYSRDELLQMTFQELTLAEDLAHEMTLLTELNAGRISRYQIEKRYRRKDGQIIWVNLHVSRYADEEDSQCSVIGIIQDITHAKQTSQSLNELRRSLEDRVLQRTQALNEANLALSSVLQQKIETEQALKNKETELAAVLHNANDAYVSTDAEGIISAWNQQAERIFGWKTEEAIGKNLLHLIIPPERQADYVHAIHACLHSGAYRHQGMHLELEGLRRNSQRLPLEVQLNAIPINDSRIISLFLRDITDKKMLERILHQEARNDVLTGLANRRQFEEMLPRVLEKTFSNRSITALLFLDLDGFKDINDTYGHETGDQLLRETGIRLSRAVRASDTVARLAGDEFVAVLDGIQTNENVTQIAQKIMEKLSSPLMIDGVTLKISASMGGAIYNGLLAQKPDAQSLLQQADQAMYQAKRAGKNCFFIVE